MGKIKDEHIVLNGPLAAWKVKDKMSWKESKQALDVEDKLKASSTSEPATGRLKSPRKSVSAREAHNSNQTDELNVR